MLNLRKIILTMMASATILGLGANIQPTLVSARHIRTYKIHRHRTYHHRNVHRHRIYRNRNTRKSHSKYFKRTRRRVRKLHQAKRTTYRRTRRAYRPYQRMSHKLSTRNDYKSYRRFSKKQIAAWAKCDEYSPKDFIKFNEQVAPTYGQYVRPYCLQGVVYLLSKYQLNHLAHTLDNMSGAEYVKKFTTPMHPKNMKYWIYDGTYNNGSFNKLGLKTVEKDSVNDINQQRAQAGVGPVTMDPGLQFIAEKHAQMYANQQCYLPHTDQNGNDYVSDLSSKYNIPVSGIGGENVGMFSEDKSWEQPSEAAKQVAYQWGPDHMSNQDNPDWTKVGVGAVPGGLVEDFEDNGDPVIGG